MPKGYGYYRNATPYPLCVSLPANDVVSIPPNKQAPLADVWPGVKAAVAKGKLIRTGDVTDAPEVYVVIDSDKPASKQ